MNLTLKIKIKDFVWIVCYMLLILAIHSSHTKSMRNGHFVCLVNFGIKLFLFS